MSHDLRSPLTAILASADALASPGLTLAAEDRLGLAETIRGEATRLDRVVEQLLDLSRLEAGAAEPHRELWHVDELVGQALAGLGAEAGRVRLEIGSDTPPVEVDAAQVERVLANLLDNALHYSPPASQVLLRAERGATELRIHVVDSGTGLPDEQREALFQPFRRGATGHGSGLGLAIARGFAEANGGRLWAQDDPGGGHLVLSLPLAERRAIVQRMSSRVLVVDDEPQILRALRTSLHGAGYEVETAETAEEALAALAANPPDAVVLDLVLPDGSGTAVCRELRTWSSAPVIVLSVVGDEAEKVAALDAGADDYVTKPFSVEELLARLRAALRRADAPVEPVVELGDLRIDLEKRAVSRRRRAGPAHAARVRAPPRARPQSGEAADARDAPARGVGEGLRRRVPLPPRLRLAAPPQARAGSGAAPLHPHRARRRLPAARAAVLSLPEAGSAEILTSG